MGALERRGPLLVQFGRFKRRWRRKWNYSRVIPEYSGEKRAEDFLCYWDGLGRAVAGSSFSSFFSKPASELCQVSPKEEAFAELYSANQQRLFGMLVIMLRSAEDAQDVLQQTAVTAWENFADFQPGTDFFRWLAALGKYEALTFINYRRRSKLHFDHELMEQLADDACKLSNDIVEERCQALAHCLTKLPEPDFKLIECRYAHGLGSHATAELLERSQASVCNSLRRIRNNLLRCIEGAIARKQLT